MSHTFSYQYPVTLLKTPRDLAILATERQKRNMHKEKTCKRGNEANEAMTYIRTMFTIWQRKWNGTPRLRNASISMAVVFGSLKEEGGG